MVINGKLLSFVLFVVLVLYWFCICFMHPKLVSTGYVWEDYLELPIPSISTQLVGLQAHTTTLFQVFQLLKEKIVLVRKITYSV